MCLRIVTIIVLLVMCVEIGKCYGNKLRVCVVDGRGGFRKSLKHCPTLDKPESKVECVVGIDRMDCLRRISKGKVDFSVFTPEDLVTAINSEVDVLLTNQMRFTPSAYEYEIVAVASDDAGIASVHDLRGKDFCHPGYGYETDWTNILANYLESTAIPQSCDTSVTLTENRIKTTSGFFQHACKAGPWVNDPAMDAKLKQTYPNLCQLCGNPGRCSITDKYWGRRGPLFCLSDGRGDIAWARLDDVRIHFGLTPGSGGAAISPDGYSLICRDGTRQPLNTTSPCVWVAKPWPVIGAQKKKAVEIQQLFNSFTHNSANEWQAALLTLIQNFKQDITPLDPIEPIESYMLSAPGFLAANSFTGCHPPRTVRMCTTSILANAKCAWLREAAAVYGVAPDVDCIKADNTTHCMEAIALGVADVLLAAPDDFHAARGYSLKPFLYETVQDSDKYLTVAIVRAASGYRSLEDLNGARACFPVYDGIAWNTAVKLLDPCGEFFGKMKAVNAPKDGNITEEEYAGEYGVIRCLHHNLADVAFLDYNHYKKFFEDSGELSQNIHREDFRVLCPKSAGDAKEEDCVLSWAPPGQLMTVANKSDTWMRDAIDVFLQLDGLFGKYYKSVTIPFSMFAEFDGKSNVLFHDATQSLRAVPYVKNDKMATEKIYEDLLDQPMHCNQGHQLNSIRIVFVVGFMMMTLFLV